MSGQAATECAEWLVRIARDLRQAGDQRLVRLSEDGVAPAEITLADELWLVALCLDRQRAMALAKETGREGEAVFALTVAALRELL